MNKAELGRQVAEECDLSDVAATMAVNYAFKIITQTLLEGEKVSLSRFGSFEMKERPPRQGRNPRTGESIPIGTTRSVRFRPSLALKRALAGDPSAI